MSTKWPKIGWLEETPAPLKTADGTEVVVYNLKVDSSDTETLSHWAKHFRQHYCLDSQIDLLRGGTGMSRAEYLTHSVFPDSIKGFGPRIRSGDFAEILIADLFEVHRGYWIPRTRYATKTVRNESSKGTDVLGFKSANTSNSTPCDDDVLIAIECKAALSRNSQSTNTLQNAINDSMKDAFRIGESLNAIKRRLNDLQDSEGVKRVQRYQNKIDTPYVRQSGAAAIFCSKIYNEDKLSKVTCRDHENIENLLLVVVKSDDLMMFVHELYGRAADEA